MLQNFRFPVRLAITSVLGLALCTTLGIGNASAKGAAKSRAAAHRASRAMDDTMDRMTAYRVTDDYRDRLPVAPAYPEAVPGQLDMYHWTDLRKMHTEDGPAADAAKIRSQIRLDDRLSNEPIKTEYEELLPVAPSYPESVPGHLDMYHWADMRKRHAYEGSAADMTKIKSQLRLDNRLSKSPIEDDDQMPVTSSYPMEAPGNLDMSHWTDFTRKHQRPGSATDVRHSQMMRDSR